MTDAGAGRHRDNGGAAGGGRAEPRGYGVYRSGEPPPFGDDLAVLVSLIAASALQPEIGYQGSWRSPDSAFTALADREVNGKAVLTVD